MKKGWDWGTIFGIIFGLFCLWMVFGGLLEGDQHTTTVNVDCSDPTFAAHSPYCNGSYADQMQEEDNNDNSYYQNTVR